MKATLSLFVFVFFLYFIKMGITVLTGIYLHNQHTESDDLFKNH